MRSMEGEGMTTDGHAFTPYPYSTGEAWCKRCGLTEDKHDRPKPLPKKGRIFEPQTAEEHAALAEWEAGQDARR